ncbi:MAG: hypothetical protein C0475_08195 [Planctomyces sp.]|nr:hypothetical protein [Planctomyces sp.]
MHAALCLSALSLTASACAAPAQATQPPQAPAQAPAVAQSIEPEAKRLLDAALSALASTASVSGRATSTTNGIEGVELGGSAQFRHRKGENAAATTFLKGNVTLVRQESTFEYVVSGGPSPRAPETVTFIDHAGKRVVTGPTSVRSEGARLLGTSRRAVLPPFLTDTKPFVSEQNAPELTLEPGTERVGGVACRVINAKLPRSQSRIWVGQDDNYPRRYVRVTGQQTTLTQSYELTELSFEPLADAQLTIAVPAGYQSITQEAPDPAATVGRPGDGVQRPLGVPVSVGGADPLAVGTKVPAVAFTTLAGEPADPLTEHAGKPIVLGFWSPQIAQSLLLFDRLKQASTPPEGAPAAPDAAAFYNVVTNIESVNTSRDAALQRARQMLELRPGTPKALLLERSLAQRLGVRGLPAVMVIDARGNLAKFFPSLPSAEAIKEAVAAAANP